MYNTLLYIYDHVSYIYIYYHERMVSRVNPYMPKEYEILQVF